MEVQGNAYIRSLQSPLQDCDCMILGGDIFEAFRSTGATLVPYAQSPVAKDDNARVAPYSKPKPTKPDSSKADKENTDAKPNSKPKLSKAAAEAQQRYSDYRDIPLEEVHGEIPCYDDATTVRRKLKKLLADKTNIPGTNKSWNQTAMSKETEELVSRDDAVEYHKNSTGPSKTGKMGGGDSPAYYWGYVLCEKLRIWEGVKKTKSREEAEQM
ncbi:MAG: hypothetical protein Q9210_000461 [Variospora velana]